MLQYKQEPRLPGLTEPNPAFPLDLDAALETEVELTESLIACFEHVKA